MNFQTASKAEQSRELFDRATRGRPVTADETLAMYANEKNWRREYDANGCKYVWQGPVICAYEAAQRARPVDQRAPWCDTMDLPREKCGCPDCGPCLVDIGQES